MELTSSDDGDKRSPRERFDTEWRHSGPFSDFILDINKFFVSFLDRGMVLLVATLYSLKLNPPFSML